MRTEEITFGPYGSPITVAELGKNEKLVKIHAEDLQKRLLPVEHKNVIGTLQMFGKDGSVQGFSRTTPLVPHKKVRIAQEAKDLAVKLYPHG